MVSRSRAELETFEASIRQAPRESGPLVYLVRRPAVDEREVLVEGHLDLALGLIGDNWSARTSSRTADGSPHPDMQLNVMNARAIAAVAGDESRWQLAGDQLFVDLDLSIENLPAGSRLALGDAVIEVTSQPHTGCGKFAQRFGSDALRWVNSPVGKELRLRGLNAKVVRPGRIRVGDEVRKVES